MLKETVHVKYIVLSAQCIVGVFFIPSHSPPSNHGLTHILTEMLQDWSLILIQQFSVV